jgi:DnaK suppressor protein
LRAWFLVRELKAYDEMNHLSSEDVRRLQQQLSELRVQLLEEIQVAQMDIKAAHEAMEGEVKSGSDASELFRFEQLRRAEIEVDNKRLNAVVDAELRMQEGLYGICKDCNGPIAPARLFALPTAIRCAACENRSLS